MKKITKVLIGTAFVVMTGALGGTIGLSVVTYNKMDDAMTVLANQQKEYEDSRIRAEKEKEEAKKKAEEEANKDPQYVTIDNQYEIKDTSAISEAYIKGNTEGLSRKDKDTHDMAKAVLDEIIKDNMSIYEKEKAVYDWMSKEINFDSSSLIALPSFSADQYTPYGVLKGKQAVCVGYATTFKLFMNMLGLDCKVVHDTSLSHSWDVVEIEDEWYMVDIALDERNNGVPMYKFFNCTSAEFSQDHTWDQSLFPEAIGVKYSYSNLNAVDVDDVNKLPQLIKSIIDGNKNCVKYYRFKQDTDEQYLSAMVSGIQERLYSFENSYMEMNAQMGADGNYILKVTYVVYESDIDDEVSDYPELNELLDKYFPIYDVYIEE